MKNLFQEKKWICDLKMDFRVWGEAVQEALAILLKTICTLANNI